MVDYNRIHKYGVELEGGWNSEPEGFIHDGSVNEDLATYSGEVPSPPFTSLDRLFNWIRQHFYDVTDESCGMHLHMSFKNIADYSVLMDGEHVQEFLFRRLKEWGEKHLYVRYFDPFWDRLSGYNNYCEAIYQPERQVHNTYKDSTRYCALNFCYAFRKTLELRVLPAFEEADTAIECIEEVSSAVNEYLKTARARNLPVVRENVIAKKKIKRVNTANTFKDINSGWSDPILTHDNYYVACGDRFTFRSAVAVNSNHILREGE